MNKRTLASLLGLILLILLSIVCIFYFFPYVAARYYPAPYHSTFNLTPEDMMHASKVRELGVIRNIVVLSIGLLGIAAFYVVLSKANVKPVSKTIILSVCLSFLTFLVGITTVLVYAYYTQSPPFYQSFSEILINSFE